ncbi:MAG: hypothetical protein HWE09_00250 [Cyclobacteriaceae bacterium]|nr:hypothetical protein [Cyclobacteriaceae bacterium]
MKAFILILGLIFLSNAKIMAQTEFVLEPSQSMLMTGKGPGQDATINPFEGEDCFALVENIGSRSFSIRVQFKGKLIEEKPIPKGKTKKIKLLKGYELYLDPNPTGIAKARVSYSKIDK